MFVREYFPGYGGGSSLNLWKNEEHGLTPAETTQKSPMLYDRDTKELLYKPKATFVEY